MSERLSLLTPAGDEMVFYANPFVQSLGGIGMAPRKLVTTQGAYQHGTTVRTVQLAPRSIQLSVLAVGDGWDDLWAWRNSLWMQVLDSPGYPLRLRKTYPDGTQRQIDCYLEESTANRALRMGTSQLFELGLYCPNPLFYNPVMHVEYFSVSGGSGNMTFPITFPITYGSSTINTQKEITYPGHWYAEPVVSIGGPLSGFIVTNLTTGKKLDLAAKSYNIVDGETVTITCKFDARSVVTNTPTAGTRILNKLSDDSDLSFEIAAPPIAVGGTNVLQVVGTGADAGTTVALSYYEMFQAL
jgi:hypothetical protein